MYSPCAAPSCGLLFFTTVASGALAVSRATKTPHESLRNCSATRECNGAFFVPVVQRNVRSALYFLTVGMPGKQSKHEPGEQRCSNGEQNVSRDSHPAQR